MINFSEFKTTVARFVKINLDDVETIWADQNEHRPDKPYCAIKIVSGPVKMGADDYKLDIAGALVLTGSREFTVSANYYGSDALEALSAIQEANEFVYNREYLEDMGGIVLVSTSTPRDLSEVQEGRVQTRGQIDIVFRAKSLALEENVGYIEKVELNNEIDGSASIVDPTA